MAKLTIEVSDTFQKPNPGGQEGFMNDYTHKWVAFAGGWYSGKTWAGARKLANIHVHNALDRHNHPTYLKSLVVAPTFPLARTINIPEMRAAFEEMGLSYRFVPDPKRYCFEMLDFGTKDNPSEILVRSADSPETITGFSVANAWGDEAARWPEDDEDPVKDALTQVRGRIRVDRPKFPDALVQANFTFTHEGDMTRMYEVFEEEPAPNHKLYRAHTKENPAAEEFVQETTAQLTTELAEQYLAGEALQTSGKAMYPAFKKSGKEANVSDRVRLIKRLPLQFSCDFNIAPGMHAIIGQYDQYMDVFTSRHLIHERRMAVPEMVDALDNILRGYKWEPGSDWPWADGALWIYGDPTGGSEHASRGESCWDVLAECCRVRRIPVKFKYSASSPHVADRVHSVNMAMRDGRGLSHYKIHPDCERLIRDYRKMKWNAEGDQDKKDRKLSHPSDADGYRIYEQRPILRIRRELDNLRVQKASAA